MHLKPIALHDIPLNSPLQFPLFDLRGKVVLAAGQQITSEGQRKALWERGVFQDTEWQPPVDTPPITTSSKTATAETANAQVLPGESEYVQYLRMNYSGTQDGFMVRYLGAAPGQSLLISAPMENGKLVFIKEGEAFDFKSFYAQAIYSFSTTIWKVCFSPFPYLHIKWPDRANMQTTPVRANRRVQLELPCALSYPLSNTPNSPINRVQKLTGVLTNLSSGGAEVALASPLPENLVQLTVSPAKPTSGDEHVHLAFRIQFAGERNVVEIDVDVVGKREANTFDLGGSYPHRYGLRFADVNRENFLLLHGYVQDVQLTRLETPLYALD